MNSRASKRVEGVLIDLGGVIYVGDEPIAGSLGALDRLHREGMPVRYLTNTTRLTHSQLLEKMERVGMQASPEEVFAPASAARDYLLAHDLEPHLLVHTSLVTEFEGITGSAGRAVVVGDAAENFTWQNLNEAFRALEAGAELVALAKNRSFRGKDGKLQLDAGPFVAALEFASQKEAVVLGKPSKDFFFAALDRMGCRPDRAAMIGDDVEADVAGAMAAGLTGILVRTGKYRQGAERSVSPEPDHVADDFAGAVDWLLNR